MLSEGFCVCDVRLKMYRSEREWQAIKFYLLSFENFQMFAFQFRRDSASHCPRAFRSNAFKVSRSFDSHGELRQTQDCLREK